MDIAVDWATLRQAARGAQAHAYCPYSGYPVGAAGIDAQGRVFVGCNVENAAYVNLHAEWAMVAAATLADAQIVAMLCETPGGVTAPCGICRQVLREHGGTGLWVATPDGPRTLAQLMPYSFGPESLAEQRR